jgi:hypothetical protein
MYFNQRLCKTVLLLLMDDRKYHQAGLVAGRLCAFIATKIAWASFTKYHQSILVLFSPIPLWTASQGLE